jgi:hypothetical protein
MSNTGNKALNIVFLFITGTCIGILTGLSVSPVIEKVLTAVLTLVTAVLSVWYGIKPDGAEQEAPRYLRYKISFMPICVFVVGLTIGVVPGIYARTHNIRGVAEKGQHITEKKKVTLGKERMEDGTFLYGDRIDSVLCNGITAYSGKSLIDFLRRQNNPHCNQVIDSLGSSHPAEIKMELLKLCRIKSF